MSQVPRTTTQEASKQWATRITRRAWCRAVLIAIAGACTAVVISQALLWRWFGAGGAWGGITFLACLIVAIGTWAVLARYAFGKGSAALHWKKLPPTWVPAALAVVLFWAATWPIGLPPAPEAKHMAWGAWITFTHGWVWLWGAGIAAGVAAAFWHALLPRLLDRAGLPRLSEALDLLPAESGPTPMKQLGALPAAGFADEELKRWLVGNDGPLGPHDKPLFDLGLKPERVIQALRPLHEFSPARTLALIGVRGGGKSTLLRLAEGSSAAKEGITLKFAYVSLWEYESASAAIRAVADEILAVTADQIDTAPFSSAAGALMRTVTGNERYWNIAAAFGLQPRTDELLGGLSTALLLARCRVIICIEDDDRIGDEAKKQFRQSVTGCLDYLRRFPAFGYVICLSSKDWTAAFNAAMDAIEPPDAREGRVKVVRDQFDRMGRGGKGTAEGAGVEIGRQMLKDIDVLRGARERAVADILDGLDTARLCREELVIEPLATNQWKPVLEDVRNMMIEHGGASADGDRFRLSAEDRKRVWDAFIKAVSGSPFLTWRPNPASAQLEFAVAGISFTPRTLRLGLGDAWRKWRAISPMLGGSTVIDPDSILVACLVRACRPDVWNALIRDVPLADGDGWPPTNYVVREAYRNWVVAGAGQGLAPSLDWSAFGYPMPHLGLSPLITNVMLKRHVGRYQLREQAGSGAGGGEGAPPNNAETSTEDREIIRPGGLIGSLGEPDPGYNWRLFLNA